MSRSYDVRPSGYAGPMIDERRERFRRIATFLDTAFRIPGTNIRFGMDAIIGLVPGIGDFVTTALGAYLIHEAREAGMPMWGLTRMAGNLAVDATIGAIPVVGDVFDLAWKANRRNLDILEKFLDEQALKARPARSPDRIFPDRR